MLGTAIVRVFDTVAATTVRPEKALRAAGIPHHAVHLHPNHHAGYFPGAALLDTRSAREYSDGHLPGALNAPHTQLRDRLAEVPTGVPVRVYCASGFRSYLALRVLRRWLTSPATSFADRLRGSWSG